MSVPQLSFQARVARKRNTLRLRTKRRRQSLPLTQLPEPGWSLVTWTPTTTASSTKTSLSRDVWQTQTSSSCWNTFLVISCGGTWSSNELITYVWAQSFPVVLAQVYGNFWFLKDKKVEFLTGRVRLETADLLRESWLKLQLKCDT